jgi:hypothetical protein
MAVCILIVFVGCSGPKFTDLGNGMGVPIESVDLYAKEHGVTREEARAQLRIEIEARRSEKAQPEQLR